MHSRRLILKDRAGRRSHLFRSGLAVGSLARAVVACCMLWLPHLSQAAIISAPFPDGFLGNRGTSANGADDIRTFTTLGISRAEFQQNSSSGVFELQGNDIPGSARFYFDNGVVVSVPGFINWRETDSGTLNLIGFIPNDNSSVTINQGQANQYVIAGCNTGGDSNCNGDDARGSSIGLQVPTSTATYSDGANIQGNAALTQVLTSLNDYLGDSESNAPAGPVTTDVLVTNDTTPTITGTVTLRDGESLQVEVDGVVYSGSDITIDTNGNWSIAITSALAVNIYNVTAAITNANGYVLQENTQEELTIFDSSATFAVTYDVNGGSGLAPTDNTAYSGNVSVTLAASTGLTPPSGKQFAGWNTAADGSGAQFSEGASYTIGANTTFYAQWLEPSYEVGGSITGLASGTAVVLGNSDGQRANASGSSFAFSKRLRNAQNFSITVVEQPTHQRCLVANETGTVSGADVSSVVVTCYQRRKIDTNAGGSGRTVIADVQSPTGGDTCAGYALGNASAVFSVPVNPPENENFPYGVFGFTVDACQAGGTVTVELQYPENLPADTTYWKDINGTWVDWTNNVTISGSTITLTLTDGEYGDTDGSANGTISDPSGPAITTTTSATYTIGGSISGLGSGKSLVLQNNSGDDLTRSANGTFTFNTAIASGSNYSVTVKTQPTGQTCSISNGSGTATADVRSVNVSCSDNAGGGASVPIPATPLRILALLGCLIGLAGALRLRSASASF